MISESKYGHQMAESAKLIKTFEQQAIEDIVEKVFSGERYRRGGSGIDLEVVLDCMSSILAISLPPLLLGSSEECLDYRAQLVDHAETTLRNMLQTTHYDLVEERALEIAQDRKENT